ncbi:hypothetical protein EV361DRAFT_893712 [Lentinula raphanica]|uniref:Nucleoprotein TPR/MLP1 domain-containing protein n=1 Tax=Lentinula raphanica TaxID=153919 RepID=A0AA38UGE1_9AGAR|nr:hypothetical protein F5880DRAFT_1542015 [Lentinula raphanica]KAJ3840509.1 hypothetical protein F5878DRAFT_67883 [Lentinula raphanica]KAJ3974614.1 hypothetical protein EV361DRAFT_893712 [Lentinula raphanica]
MVGTRRTSKITSVEEGEASSSTQATQSSFTVPVPEDFDIDAFTSIVPDFDIHSPTPDSLLNLYRLILEQSGVIDASQRDLDELRAEAEKKDVELDQALQDNEQSSKDLEQQVERLQEELTQVKQERDQLLASQTELQTRVTTLASSQSSSSHEVEELKHRLEDVEHEKRDLVNVISRLKQDGSERDDEVNTLRSNLKEARAEHSELESKFREARATETSTKFKLESLTQQLSLAQSEVERVNSELTTKSEEYSNYRRTKQAELVTLQASLSDMTQNYSSSQATLKTLQASYASQTHQLTQALTKVQDLNGQLAEQEATYSTETNSLRRLIEVLEAREKQAKDFVENMERDWAGLGERADEREASFKLAIEKEKKAREEAEKKIEHLEKVLDRMGRGELPLPGRGAVGTPSRRTSGAFDEMHDGLMGLSPTVAMVSKAQKSGKSFTEVYTDYIRLQEAYEKKCIECSNMEVAMDDILVKIEERAPLLSQQRVEYERLQSEASQLASELAQAISDRDAQFNLAQENAQKLVQSSRENDLLQEQLGDLGVQIQTLLKEIARRDDPNIPSDEELANVAPAEDVEHVITNNLVAFRSIDGIQQQNQRLLGIVRRIGQQMEDTERKNQEKMEMEQAEAIREAHEAMQDLAAQLERQKKHSDGVIQAYAKERDAYKAMLARSTQNGGLIANGSMDIDAPDSSSDLARELAEIQSQFEAYRTEMGIDSVKLREDNIAAQREIGQLQAALAKASAKSENQTERLRMLQDQINLQNQERNDFTRINQQLNDQCARADIECNRLNEELIVASTRVEQLRSECANLRAEKGIWESIQSRLVEENKSLAMERSHLSALMGNVQKMHSELERSGENERRRLENQLQLLENQSQDLRNQVTQERETIRTLSLQKDVEIKDLQNRLDKSVQDLSKTREALVIAETSKVHLEERVGDLTKNIKGNEEKLAVYEHRGSHSTMEHSDMSREQQLEAEVANLRSSLKVVEFDLAQAKGHVQQFQSISEANENALREFQSTHEEYIASSNAQIAKIESDKQALEERLQAAQSELTELTTKYNQLQKQHEHDRVTWANDKKTLEDTIVDLSTTENDRETHAAEMKQQEERAKLAEERYSNEILSHAETIKNLESTKKQLTATQATVRDHQLAAETATSKLAASEASWQHQKQTLDNEVKDLQRRCNDLVAQNNVLHNHLETVSSQAARIQQAADATTSAGVEAEGSDTSDTKLSEMRSVVAYLRKEKEIVDLQLDLSKQENTRLKTQIEHLHQNLNETRQALSEEREKAIETAASGAKHEELMERINQMNILRESNATLRSEGEARVKRVQELESKLELLTKQLEPTREEARLAQAELQARDTQIERLEEENRRWQSRNQQLLSKYDRVDPSEIQAVKDENERLKAENTSLDSTSKERDQELAKTKSRVEALEKALASYKDTYTKNMNSFKSKLGELNTVRSKLTAEKKELEDKVGSLEEQTRNLQTSLESLKAEKTAPETAVNSSSPDQTELVSLRAERDQLLAEKASLMASTTGSEVSTTWETEKAALIAAKEEVETQLKAAIEKAETASNTAKSNKAAFERLNQRLQAISKARQEDAEKASSALEAAVSAAVEKVKGEVQTTELSPDDTVAKHQAEMKALEERLIAQHQNELKAAASSKDSASDLDVEAAIAAAIAAHDKEREAKIAEEISAAVERGRMEIASKMKLRDSQVFRAQTKLKEYEAQIQAWKQEGLLPKDAKVAPLPNKPPPPPSPSMSSNASASAASSTAGPSTKATLPQKPSDSSTTNATPSTSTTVPTTGVGRGRGGPAAVVRGAIRGARGAAAGAGRGAKQPSQPLSGGITIQGAAKRPAPDSTGDDTLAKRLKPAPGNPVTLRRPPPAQ